MTRNSSRIDRAARRLLSSIAGTRGARVSAFALAQMGGAGEALMEAGLLVPHGSSTCIVASDDLDDTPVAVITHPLTGRAGHLGNWAWQDERTSERRRVHALDMAAGARRVVAKLDCSLGNDPVPYLDDAALDFGTARLPRRAARVGIWVARGLTRPEGFAAFRELVQRRPSDGLRVVIVLDPPGRMPVPFIRGHELVALEDVVEHEDGLAVAPEILAARLLKGPSHQGPVWVSGDGGVLIVHGKWHEFTGGKQKIAVAMLAEAWLDGDPVLPVARILEEAECGPSVKRLKDLFGGHPTWREVIRESGSNCWLEV
ncbi:hypothetical protein SAMN05216257_10954 [Meinhardsimonia xiamenensis]|jgi:hypothetical protein|uniref:Uncharacterized protein n=1 Tax=Meinhardsimonia xiamenensis TaxID=990712 RepID=A0A1G9GYN1_9RHOB|nr:hypothetical protein [Meinhardsimonia xiamenensis]PRX29927.1 hypothetical protein LV81_02793 [Meinhardsimonia xiamenensis]SDL05393.1 hypothetical protein SAMN05216257_10954 [Meinhardsimonia xiamenensis]